MAIPKGVGVKSELTEPSKKNQSRKVELKKIFDMLEELELEKNMGMASSSKSYLTWKNIRNMDPQ